VLDTNDGLREVSVRSFFPLSLALCLVGNASPVFADKDMLQKNNCFACHSIDKRKYGPKLVEVAKKYAGNDGAVQMLAKKIQSGGTGVWGEDIMPPQPQVSDADATALAEYILSLP
jgi:cytochrome c